MTHFNYETIPTNDTNYRCHVQAIELVYPLIYGSYYGTLHYYIVIKSLGNTFACTQTNFLDKCNFKKCGAHWPRPVHLILKVKKQGAVFGNKITYV